MSSHDSALEPPPVVTAAILAFNRRDELATTLSTLLTRLDWPAGRLEIVVVDNASTDGTAEMVRERFPSVKLILSPTNEGIGAWNRAFAVGRGDWFLVLDDDCHISGTVLRQAVEHARRHAADMVSFGVDSTTPGVAFSDAYRTGLLSFWGCAVLIARGPVEVLGGFESRLFLWCHEVEYTMRFLNAGFRHLTLPDLRALHMKPVPPIALSGHRRNMQNWGFIAGKLLRPVDAAMAVLSLLVRAMIEAVAFPGFHAGAPAVLAGFRDGLKVRQPLRAPVSRLYRRNFIDFTSHFRPVERIRHLARRAPNYREQFWLARERLYPDTPASVRVP
jgi:glycosyltransferase involved in cell wall biosynthesis